MYGLFLDPTYLCFMIPALLLTFLAQWYVNSSYSTWSKIAARSGLSGAQAAQRLIGAGGLDVRVEEIGGRLSDHYDPRDKVLRLSQGSFEGRSVASLAVAAHELGHAVQDQQGYFPLRLRAALVPAVNIGSYLGWILIFIGLFMRLVNIAWAGVAIFALGAVFALATLPVELNASPRAKRLLSESGIIYGDDEQRGVNRVLNAAALTYVAALVTALTQLLYYAILVMGMGRRRS